MAATTVKIISKPKDKAHLLILADKKTNWAETGFSKENVQLIKHELGKKSKPIVLTEKGSYRFVIYNEPVTDENKEKEVWRKDASKVTSLCNEYRLKDLTIQNFTKGAVTVPVIEGIILSNYEFLKYRSKEKNQFHTLQEISVTDSSIDKKDLQNIEIVTESTMIARDLINEPLSYLTAEQLSAEIKKLGKKAGFKVEVFNKTKITTLKMGGLLAVNLGSPNPPTFNVLEWKPKNAKNKKPIVLVGKGVVYDTGGLSLKPTPNSMDYMKSDMSGAAAMVATLYAAAKAKLPLHIVGLIPATENRPGGNAYVPGDVIKMHSGLTVEVLNTDAEGRMILADALSYAKKYDPELVIDMATLTGAAARAIGQEGIVFMGNASQEVKDNLAKSGNAVHERLVEFPMWEEYDSYIKSDIADIKNVGGPYAGATTAGIFLRNFTDYPWLHLDIAGVAYLQKDDGYRLKNGTGVGVRLLFDFLKNQK